MNTTRNNDSGAKFSDEAKAESYQSTNPKRGHSNHGGGRSGCGKFKSHDERMTVVTPAGISIEGVSFQQAVAITKSMEMLYGVRIEMNNQGTTPKTSASRKPKSLKEYEIDAIRKALIANKGNKSATAKDLGIARNTLDRKLEAYGIQIQTSVA